MEGGGNQKQERGPAGCVKTFKATLLDACHCVMSIQRALFGTSQASSYFRPSQGARAVERALGTWLPFSAAHLGSKCHRPQSRPLGKMRSSRCDQDMGGVGMVRVLEPKASNSNEGSSSHRMHRAT